MRLSKTLLAAVHAAMAAGGTLPIPQQGRMRGKAGIGGSNPPLRCQSAAEVTARVNAAKDKRERKQAKRARDAARSRK